MPGLLGKKIGMTSVFSAEGKNVPCTVIELGPCVVTQIKSVEKDGYNLRRRTQLLLSWATSRKLE